MAYASVSDMTTRYGFSVLQILAEKKTDYDENGNPQQTVEQIIDAALTDASAAIDGYIDGRATLPLKVVPAALVRLACVLARYAMEDGVATEKALKEYEDALRLLEKVSTGDISLGLSVDDERPESGDIAIMENAGSVFSRRQSKGFI